MNLLKIRDLIQSSIETKNKLLEENFPSTILEVGQILVQTLKSDKKILIAGNGGSAADAQHFAAELAGQFRKPRKGLPALALTTNTSVITAIGNDQGYDEVFSRQIEAYGNPGDIFVAISTSSAAQNEAGHSTNILKAVETAKKQNLKAIGLLGKDGGQVKELCDFALIVPSFDTQRIQEAHILIIHILCDLIEEALQDEQN